MNLEGKRFNSDESLDPLANLSAALELTMDELRRVVVDVLEVRSQVFALRDELVSKKEAKLVQIRPRKRRNFGRIGHGIKTPKEAFYVPILNTLKEAAGSMPRSQVIAAIEKEMTEHLTEVDYERQHANGAIRWTVTCDQARQKLVEDGRMKQGSKTAIWEITPYGLAWLNGKSK